MKPVFFLFALAASMMTFSAVSAMTSANHNSTDVVSADEKPKTPVNKFCPIMLGKVSDKANTVVWKDKVIGFCCNGCDKKWTALTDAEKETKLKAALEKEKK